MFQTKFCDKKLTNYLKNNGLKIAFQILWKHYSKTFKTMKPQFQYSLVYGLLNLATTERLSVGVIYVNNDEIKFKYSQKKMDALKLIMNGSEHSFLSRIIKNLDNSCKKESPSYINYLSRYSNNLIQFSPLTTIDLEPTPKNYKWLFETYVYKKPDR